MTPDHVVQGRGELERVLREAGIGEVGGRSNRQLVIGASLWFGKGLIDAVDGNAGKYVAAEEIDARLLRSERLTGEGGRHLTHKADFLLPREPRSEDVRVFEREGLARGVQLLRKALELRATERILGRIMLEVVLEGQRVFVVDDVVGVAVDLDRVKLRASTQKLHLTPFCGRIADEELTAWQLGLQQGERDRIDRSCSRESDCGEDRLQSGWGPVGGQAERSEAGSLRFELNAIARELVAGVEEESVMNEGAAELRSKDVAVKSRFRKVGFIIEEGCS